MCLLHPGDGDVVFLNPQWPFQEATRGLYDSWRLLFEYLHHFNHLSGTPEKSDIETRIVERFTAL